MRRGTRPDRPRAHFNKPPRIDFDETDGCWRIYVYDVEFGRGEYPPVCWWPLSWLRFASEEAANAHLQTRGAW